MFQIGSHAHHKHNFQSNLTYGICQFTWYHTMKNNVGWFKILVCQPHATEGLIIQNVDAAPSIHKYIGELITSHLRCHNQSQVTRIVNMGRMIHSAPYNRLLGPPQVTWYCRFNNINYPLMKLLITLAQTSSGYMILPTIQLLWVTLVTRLLLISLITLLVITTLVVLVALIILKS